MKKYQKNSSFGLNIFKIEQSELSAIELDNKDLIISSYDDYELKINIYRYNQNNDYILTQKIEEPIKNNIVFEKKPPEPCKKIKKLSGNRFMTTLNDSAKIYSSNKNNIYEIIFSHNLNCIKDFYEIDEKNFIFFIYESHPNNKVYQNFSDIHAYQ